jgi:hypothetical protein
MADRRQRKSDWGAIRIRRQGEVRDYELNSRGQLRGPFRRQRRRQFTYTEGEAPGSLIVEVSPVPTGTEPLRVARLDLPANDEAAGISPIDAAISALSDFLGGHHPGLSVNDSLDAAEDDDVFAGLLWLPD